MKHKNFPTIRLGADDNNVVILFGINAFCFLALYFLKLVYIIIAATNFQGVYLFQKAVFSSFNLSANTTIFLHHPWTILTYSFSTDKLVLFISNMLWLGVLGSIFLYFGYNKKLLPIYLYGGLIGGAVFVISNFVTPTLFYEQPFWGLESCINPLYAMAGALFIYLKKQPYIYFKQAKINYNYILLVFIGLSFFQVEYNIFKAICVAAASFLTGILYAYFDKKGKDGGRWIYFCIEKINASCNPKKSKQNR